MPLTQNPRLVEVVKQYMELHGIRYICEPEYMRLSLEDLDEDGDVLSYDSKTVAEPCPMCGQEDCQWECPGTASYGPDARSIIEEYMDSNGYDAVYDDVTGCSCQRHDLFPCACVNLDACKLGYWNKCLDCGDKWTCECYCFDDCTGCGQANRWPEHKPSETQWSWRDRNWGSWRLDDPDAFSWSIEEGPKTKRVHVRQEEDSYRLVEEENGVEVRHVNYLVAEHAMDAVALIVGCRNGIASLEGMGEGSVGCSKCGHVLSRFVTDLDSLRYCPNCGRLFV